MMFHRLLYMAAGLFLVAGVWGVAQDLDNAAWPLLQGLALAVWGYFRELEFHLAILNKHMAQRKPPT